MQNDFFFWGLVLLNFLQIGIYLHLTFSKKKLVHGLSRLIHDFEREKSVLLQIEAINPENVYLKNPRAR